VCEQLTLGSLSTSAFFLGLLVGAFVGGALSDRYSGQMLKSSSRSNLQTPDLPETFRLNIAVDPKIFALIFWYIEQ